ncbi:MAG: putative porin [Terriglobales bacterium]|jgi:hypothetical protein
MKAVATFLAGVTLCAGMFAQSTTSSTTTTTKMTTKHKARSTAKPSAVTQSDLAAIRQMMQQQQQQLQDLKNELQQKDAVIQQTQQQLSNLQNATSDAQNKAAAAQEASNQSAATVSSLKSDVSDIKLNTTNAATSTQEDQKRMSALEGIVNRFRFSGDARVRGESFFQSYPGCPAGSCEDRNRVRLRLRLGVDGKLSEDFNAGIYLATGIWSNGSPSFTDPISTNETATGFFEKKTIGLDRGWITYNPTAHKWLNLTGGKFAYTWQRTNYMFDPDLNPEGFSEKFSFDTKNTGFLKNVTLQGMQLIFNEVSKGRDGKAIGGQFLTKMQPIHAWTFTPSFTLLDWSNVDAIANAADPLAVCKTAVTLGCLPQANTSAVGTPVAVPTVAPLVTLANGVTNATVVLGTGAKQTRGYLSRFTNADLILDNSIATPFKRFPIHILGEYEKNLRAATARDTMFVGLAEVGQAKEKHDFIFGYTFNNTNQDAVISSFAESDQRSPTNVIQHKFYAGWMVAKNTQALFTWWHGRVQDMTLPNTALLQNNVLNPFPTTGIGAFNPATMKDPWLNRLQLDLIYKF